MRFWSPSRSSSTSRAAASPSATIVTVEPFATYESSSLTIDGPRRFQDLQESLAGASPNTLSARLKKLEENGIVERRFYAQHPPRAEYALTDKVRELGPVMKAPREWGNRQKP